MLKNDWTTPVSQHWLPRDAVSKFALLELFAKSLGLTPSGVAPVQAADSLNRILVTQDQKASEALWRLAGYSTAPSIDELCQEFIAADRKLGSTNEQK
jgi:methylphosphotriester-DNA--protein-cysteine methyltransferase